jgi:hypothetical protein
MKAVLKEAYRDEVPDVIRQADFAEEWPDAKAALENAWRTGRTGHGIPTLWKFRRAHLRRARSQ